MKKRLLAIFMCLTLILSFTACSKEEEKKTTPIPSTVTTAPTEQPTEVPTAVPTEVETIAPIEEEVTPTETVAERTIFDDYNDFLLETPTDYSHKTFRGVIVLDGNFTSNKGGLSVNTTEGGTETSEPISTDIKGDISFTVNMGERYGYGVVLMNFTEPDKADSKEFYYDKETNLVYYYTETESDDWVYQSLDEMMGGNVKLSTVSQTTVPENLRDLCQITEKDGKYEYILNCKLKETLPTLDGLSNTGSTNNATAMSMMSLIMQLLEDIVGEADLSVTTITDKATHNIDNLQVVITGIDYTANYEVPQIDSSKVESMTEEEMAEYMIKVMCASLNGLKISGGVTFTLQSEDNDEDISIPEEILANAKPYNAMSIELNS